MPTKLDAQKQAHIISDDHLAYQPNYPFEPTFRALATFADNNPADSKLNFSAIDVVTDNETLANVYNFLANHHKTGAFRIDCTSINNSVFVTTKQHHGRGHTDKGRRVGDRIPTWAADAVTRTAAYNNSTLPSSGSHYRLVRYSLGDIECAVRAKIDFAYNHRQEPLTDAQQQADPLQGSQPVKMAPNKDGTVIPAAGQTVVKPAGRGTKPDKVGVTAVRYAATQPHFDSYTRRISLARCMPALWFGRIAYLADAVVTSPRDLVVERTTLLPAREYFKTWERRHQLVLTKVAGLLKEIKQWAQELGGSFAVVFDPNKEAVELFKPILQSSVSLPEDIETRFWRGITIEETLVSEEWEDDEDSLSELSELSGTPPGFEDWKLNPTPQEPDMKRHRLVPQIKQPMVQQVQQVTQTPLEKQTKILQKAQQMPLENQQQILQDEQQSMPQQMTQALQQMLQNPQEKQQQVTQPEQMLPVERPQVLQTAPDVEPPTKRQKLSDKVDSVVSWLRNMLLPDRTRFKTESNDGSSDCNTPSRRPCDSIIQKSPQADAQSCGAVSTRTRKRKLEIFNEADRHACVADSVEQDETPDFNSSSSDPFSYDSNSQGSNVAQPGSKTSKRGYREASE